MSREAQTVLKFPILIGDIGGTNARFAILKDAFAEPKMFETVKTADFTTSPKARCSPWPARSTGTRSI